MSTTIQLRRDTAANWTTANPVLASGEVGIETDTGKFKLGNAASAWGSLGYWNGGGVWNGGTATEWVAPAVVTVTDGSTVVVNAALGNVFRMTLTTAVGSSRTIAAPENPVDGQQITFDLIQPASGGPLGVTWASGAGAFTFGSGAAPGLSAAAGASDLVTFRYSGAMQMWHGVTGTAIGDVPADLQPAGVAAAGSTGLAADAGHVHPLQPWQFAPEAYGAKGDGQVASDVATNGTQTFTSSTISANAVVGQWVMINGGRGTDVAAIGTITAISGVSITISSPVAPINATASGLNAIWGTDDTAAINAAVSAASTYAQARDYSAEVVFRGRIYVVAGLTQSSNGTALYNTQIPIPYPASPNGRKLVIGLRGVSRADHGQYWNTTVPQLAGTVIASMQFAPLNIDPVYGPQSVIGAPTPESGMAGGISPTFVNHKPVVENIQVVCSVYTNITAFDYTYSCAVYTDGCSALAFAQSLEGNGVLLSSIWQGSSYGNTQGRGLRLPTVGNNADSYVPSFTVSGFSFGVTTPSEHTLIDYLRVIYSGVAVQVVPGNSGHGLTIGHCTAEAYQVGLALQSGPGGDHVIVHILSWSTENSATQCDVYDPNSSFYGEMRWFDTLDPSHSTPIVDGALNFRIVNEVLGRGVWSSAPAVPASTIAQQNTAWRDAWVYVSGGTVTGIAVDGTTLTGVTSGPVRVPSGHTITLTYSAAPTWQWILD